MKRDKLNHLIVGLGEVGYGLLEFLGHKTNVWGVDTEEYPPYPAKIDMMHVCIPYDSAKQFNTAVKGYIKRFKPKYTIVHSTVPLGTCDKLGVIHSPIRGVHPNLAKGIKTFLKYFGGKQSQKVATMFNKYGCPVAWSPKARDTEALKIWDTAQYGWNIVLMKEIYRWCKKNKVDFDLVYKSGNATYNLGYQELGRPEVVRPNLFYKKGKIGGHCVIQNLRFLDSFVAPVIKGANNRY